MRNLLLFLLVLFAIWWIRRALKRPSDGGTRSKGAGKAKGALTEQMVECAHCGVHVPESEGVRDGSRFFCSEEHRRLGAGRPER